MKNIREPIEMTKRKSKAKTQFSSYAHRHRFANKKHSLFSFPFKNIFTVEYEMFGFALLCLSLSLVFYFS